MTHIRSIHLLVAAFAAVAFHCPAAPGELDTSFSPSVGGNLFNVYAGSIQPVDGKIIIGGSFSSVASNARSNIARMSSTGSVDSTTTFAIGSGANNPVYCTAVQPDGKILVGGVFGSFNGVANSARLVRLNANGSVDSTFTPGTGPDDLVHAIVVQPDGKIIIGGLFVNVGGQPRNRIARLSANGALESTTTFDVGTGANENVYSLALQPDGRIVVGGRFTNFNGQPRNYVARLESNGALESTTTFNPGSGPDNRVNCVTLQPDGRILLGGDFENVNGQPRVRVARLAADGALESTTTFNPAPVDELDDYDVYSMALQADGRIVLGGGFLVVGSENRSGIARLNANGSLDLGFDPGTGVDGADVNGVALQADGKVLLMGTFTTVNSFTRNLLARLQNDATTQSLAISYSQIQWLRSGAAPEVSQTTFELSTNGGSTWSTLGTPTAITGGWQLSGLTLPTTGSIRARGRTLGGYFNGSSGITEQVQSFTVSPPSPSESWRLTHFGTTANTGNAADTATPDNDAIPNLIKYGLCITPGSSGSSSLPQAQQLGGRLAVSFVRDPGRNDITIHVDVADSLALLQSSPTTIASSINGAVTTGAGVISETDAAGGRKSVEVRDTSTTAQRRFMRIQVAR
jgi:uncharacterized delta-60 repeat protein